MKISKYDKLIIANAMVEYIEYYLKEFKKHTGCSNEVCIYNDDNECGKSGGCFARSISFKEIKKYVEGFSPDHIVGLLENIEINENRDVLNTCLKLRSPNRENCDPSAIP